MLWVIRYVLWALYRLAVSLRYRIHLHGADQVRDLKGPVLVLPNHPSRMDPSVVITPLWPWLYLRPVLFEGNFQNPLFYPVMGLLRAIRVPDLSHASSRARARAEEAIGEVIAALRRGENVVMWPSGRTQRGGVEVLGGARAAADILRQVPEAQLVLVRTRGLWGSRFSAAPTGGSLPPLFGELWVSAGLVLANLLFFMPRRRVDITVERVDRARLPELQRETLNPWLEAWYNADVRPEPPTFVPYHFLFGPRTHSFPSCQGAAETNLAQVKPEVRQEVNDIVERKLRRPLTESENRPETTLDQLGLDSLDQMDVALSVEQQFGFSSDEVGRTLGEQWVLAQGLAAKTPAKQAPRAWFRQPADATAAILGDTIAEAFVSRALANRRDTAVADDLAGAIAYDRLLTGALLLARRFRPLTSANVGLMLPSSVACDTAFLGLQLAGKLPVLLNWTTGPANLSHAARTMQLTHVVTSEAFLDRTNIAVEGVEYLFIEDLHKAAGSLEKWRTLLAVWLAPQRVRGQVPRPDADQPAVVLFTSGSERAPKAVPLTHRNLLSNARGCLAALGVSRRDPLLGFLPAFHSFGLSITGLLPLLAGLRLVHHPDPTAASTLARKISAYQPTVLAGTPTFIGYILDRAEPGQLASLRLIVVGAERCPESVFQRCAAAAPKAQVLEGYGITECSPAVAVNRPGANRPGTVGQPLPGVEVGLTDRDLEGDVLPAGMTMVEVSGPTVFPGYLGYDGPSPFREHDGKRWYLTGDLAERDADGFLRLRGRLKRFLKAGGEMISLEALEAPFTRRYPPAKEGPRVAVEGVERSDGTRHIALFTPEPIDLRAANALLLEEGFRGVMRLDEVRQVEKVPVLETGKTDYKALRTLLTQAGEPAVAGVQ